MYPPQPGQAMYPGAPNGDPYATSAEGVPQQAPQHTAFSMPTQYQGQGAYGAPAAPLQPQAYPPQAGFVPSSYPAPGVQPYNPMAYQQQQQQQQNQQQHQQQPGHAGAPPQQDGAPGGGFGIPMNPFNMLAAGSTLFAGSQSWGQQYVQRVQQRVGYFTGGTLNAMFAIDQHYVNTKLLMLLAPYLKRWTYTRVLEQVQGITKYKPPRVDHNSPDLYVPLMSLWAYVILICLVQAGHQKFKPDNMYGLVWSGCMAWGLHIVVAKVIMKAMNLSSSITWVDLAAYTGYAFVPICLSIVLGQAAGVWGYYAAWLYGSLCMSVFLVRTMKRIIFQEARLYSRGGDLTITNYLLLALAIFQFPFAFWMGVRP